MGLGNHLIVSALDCIRDALALLNHPHAAWSLQILLHVLLVSLGRVQIDGEDTGCALLWWGGVIERRRGLFDGLGCIHRGLNRRGWCNRSAGGWLDDGKIIKRFGGTARGGLDNREIVEAFDGLAGWIGHCRTATIVRERKVIKGFHDYGLTRMSPVLGSTKRVPEGRDKASSRD